MPIFSRVVWIFSGLRSPWRGRIDIVKPNSLCHFSAMLEKLDMVDISTLRLLLRNGYARPYYLYRPPPLVRVIARTSPLHTHIRRSMHHIGTLIGFFGILKYVLDKTMIDCLQHFQEAIHEESLRQSGKLTNDEQQLLVLNMATRLWGKVVDDPSKRKITLLSKVSSFAGSVYNYLLPGPVRDLLFVPAYIVTYPVRFFVDKKKMELLREQTRRMAAQGLWSFIVHMVFAIFTASILVQEVEYVRVVNGQGPNGPEVNQHLVKRVVIGVGHFSFFLPHHALIYIVSYSLVMFAVFHTVSFFVLLANYGDDSPR